jgi:hypothetical protein
VGKLSSNPNFDAKFLKAHGFGKDEALWITQYDSFSVRGGFLSPYMIVGRDPPTNSFCGKHRSYLKCDLTDLHGSIGGQDFYHNSVTNCHSYRCRLCWKYGWCVTRANVAESRFLTAEKVLGLPYADVEHLSASVPKRLYDLSPQEMAKEAILALKRSGVIGGENILHPFRKDLKRRDLFPSFHYHCLGYIQGGYDRCRNCIKVGHCWDCDGFEGATRRAHRDDGWIVSLARNEKGIVEKRNSIFGTTWYQCEHAGYKVGVRRFQIVEWWGNVAKRKFKTDLKRLEHKCGVCGNPLKRSFLPEGVEPIVANRGERGFLKNFTLPHVEDEDGQFSHLRDEDGRR